MVAVTFGVARVPTAEAARKAGSKTARKTARKTSAQTGRVETAVPGKSWFARILNALIEARMEQARREIRMHTHLLPYTFDERGNRLVKTDAGNMPLGGW